MVDGIGFEIEDGIGTLLVKRPDARNALDWAAQERFAQVIRAAGANTELRVLIITGSGPTFVAGGDLKELASRRDKEAGARLNRVMSGALHELQQLPVPVIAAVNGDAAGGGCEILTACDLRLAVAGAHLRFVQVRLGLTTGWGGARRLVRLVGQSRALEVLLSGRALTAEEAADIGLIHRVVAPGTALEEARRWAQDLRSLPREALAAMKRLVYLSAERSDTEVAHAERELFLQLWGQPDHEEAVVAFLEKRDPHFGR